MEALAYVLCAVGFVGFGSAVVYELIHHRREGGPVYQGRKHIVFPWAIASWLVFGAGFAIFASSRF